MRERPLGELLASVEGGVSVNSEDRVARDGEIGVLKTSAVTYGTFAPHEHKAVVPVERARAKRAVRGGTILFSRMNTPGLVAASAYVEKDHPHLFLPDRLWELVVQPGVDARWLSQVLASAPVRAELSARASGTSGSMKNISKEKLLSLPIAVPSLDEQRRIAAVLSALDARALAGAEVADAATAFKSALLHHEFQVTDHVPLDDINQTDRPICYGILMPGQGHPGGVPVVKVKDIKGGVINTDSLLLTSPELDHEYRRSRLRAGDVLLTIRGTAGRVAVVPPQLDGANITQDTARISVDDPTLRDWVYYALQAPDVQQQIADNTRGQAVKGINIGDVRKLSIPMPAATERSRIVAVLAANDRLIRSSLAEVRAVQATKNAVAHVLLGAAA